MFSPPSFLSAFWLLGIRILRMTQANMATPREASQGDFVDRGLPFVTLYFCTRHRGVGQSPQVQARAQAPLHDEPRALGWTQE